MPNCNKWSTPRCENVCNISCGDNRSNNNTCEYHHTVFTGKPSISTDVEIVRKPWMLSSADPSDDKTDKLDFNTGFFTVDINGSGLCLSSSSQLTKGHFATGCSSCNTDCFPAIIKIKFFGVSNCLLPDVSASCADEELNDAGYNIQLNELNGIINLSCCDGKVIGSLENSLLSGWTTEMVYDNVNDKWYPNTLSIEKRNSIVDINGICTIKCGVRTIEITDMSFYYNPLLIFSEHGNSTINKRVHTSGDGGLNPIFDTIFDPILGHIPSIPNPIDSITHPLKTLGHIVNTGTTVIKKVGTTIGKIFSWL